MTRKKDGKWYWDKEVGVWNLFTDEEYNHGKSKYQELAKNHLWKHSWQSESKKKNVEIDFKLKDPYHQSL